MAQTKKTVRVDITSDIMCPWCIIGFKRFSKVMIKFKDVAVFNINWNPFELYPRLEKGGLNLYKWMQEKKGMSMKQILDSRKIITVKGKELGFIFNYSDSSKIYNTSLAHQLLHWAADFNEKQTDLKVAIFEAHFTHNLAIDDKEVLVNIAGKVGLDKQIAKEILEDQRYFKEIREKERAAKRKGIRSIPFYLFNNSFMVEDSQSPTGFEDAIQSVIDS